MAWCLAALLITCRYSLNHKLKHIRYVVGRFTNEDHDHDGKLNFREFLRAIRTFNIKLSDLEIESLFNVFADQANKLDIMEFMRAVRSFQRSAIEACPSLPHPTPY